MVAKGPVVDFLDHSLVIYKEAKDYIPRIPNEMYEKVHVVDFQPTCENLVLYIAGIIKSRLSGGVDLFSVRLYETPTSYAEWLASDNQL
jgi:6-pyruvoyltetrahydropterin/6-carboxytetrahydropterin synthase